MKEIKLIHIKKKKKEQEMEGRGMLRENPLKFFLIFQKIRSLEIEMKSSAGKKIFKNRKI